MRKLTIPLILIITLVLMIFIAKSSGSNSTATTKTKSTASTSKTKDNMVVSSDKVYFQSITPEEGVPFDTATDPNYPGLSIFWVKASVADGQDTCSLYDNTTLQIYANRYISNGQLSTTESGTTYYPNSVINQEKAIKLINNLCFKP